MLNSNKIEKMIEIKSAGINYYLLMVFCGGELQHCNYNKINIIMYKHLKFTDNTR